MLNKRSDKVELLRIAEAVALEKSINKEIILSTMESAIQKAAKTRFGFEKDELPNDLSLALGSYGLSPLQNDSYFSVFANGA